MKGNIKCKSTKGEGTKFMFDFKAKISEEVEEVSEEAPVGSGNS
jgi:hypothetical protein